MSPFVFAGDPLLRCRRSRLKLAVARALSAGALGTAMATGAPLALAQDAAEQRSQDALEEVLVTGSRILRSGYDTPTPVTVLSEEWLQVNTATANLADTLNTLPVFANPQTPSGSVSGVSAAAQGMNILNLRGIGGDRTLTLFDGQRSVPSMFTGIVDINNFPQQLISRVETVTGGASAVYGSDAVAGVVNFILDREFTGFKGDVSTGQTTYGDDTTTKVALSGGFPFADGRGHVLLSSEYADRDGVTPGAGGRGGGRSWNESGWGIMINPDYTPTNGQPEWLVRPEISLSNATHGGIIIAGPLRGTAFGPGGEPFQLHYGEIVNDPWMQGGAWRDTEIRHDRSGSLEPENRRRNFFGRISYDVTDAINVFAQVAWADNETFTSTWPAFQAGNGPTILSGNPFIPESVQARMDDLGVDSFRIGSMNYNLPNFDNWVDRTTERLVVGADGAFNDTWSWSAYFQRGETTSETSTEVLNLDHYPLAVDAVRHPDTGEIVCRVTLEDPSSNCVPWNPLGLQAPGQTQEALDYVWGLTGVTQTYRQDVYSTTVTGEAFSTWAGPVGLAFNAEYRDEKAQGKPWAPETRWFAGNFDPFSGANSVWETAVEMIVPLASGAPMAESFDLHLAYRYTDYEATGSTDSWKIGAVWAPTPSLRIRTTRSRDIRAPNFSELFVVQDTGFRSAFDPFTNTTPQFFGARSGNLNLQPEFGDTYELGIVWRPGFLPGFAVAVDYWDIEVSGGIGEANDDQILQFCFDGRQDFCTVISRDAEGVVDRITRVPFNLGHEQRTGVDLDVTHVIGAGRGSLGIRGLATFYTKSTRNDGLGSPTTSTLGNVGQFFVGPPNWRASLNFAYSMDELRASLTARLLSSNVLNDEWIECTANSCPPSNPVNRTVELNNIPSTYYLDASVSRGFQMRDVHMEVFFNVRNLLDRDPEILPTGPTDFTYVSPLSRPGRGYDLLGRQFLLGLRASF